MAIHGKLFSEHAENQATDPFVQQNKKLLKVSMAYGPVWARTGSMVAYQGRINFKNKGSGGLNKMLKSAMTGEGVDLMECTGEGELFLAHDAADIQIFYLENDSVSVNGNSVLAFSASIDWDIHRIQARGGMMTG
ncbi:MAG: AIM24 family protein, partial [Actinomycetales bacterium]|nr:AIM24 family protein [Actinomycetales bacterium]